MDERIMEQQEALGVDLRRALMVLWQKSLLIVIVSLIGALAAFVGTYLLITPKYESTAMFYVNNSASNAENSSQSITSSDISAAKNLVESYIVILNTNATLEEIIEYADVDYSCEALAEMITAEPVNSTEIFSVTVESSSPDRAAKIANAIAVILPTRISGIIDGTSAIVVDYPTVATKPSSPSYVQSAMIGFILAFVVMVGVILLHEIFDVTIRTEEDIEQNCKYPVLANIPDMTQSGKDIGYGYGIKLQKQNVNTSGRQVIVGSKLNFAATEAYKLLRAKLQFSFADENDCHVIGVSSALSGEGKSLSAANLAYTMSQLNKRVLLIDCDMRRPTMAEKLRIEKYPGLSNFLTGHNKLDEVIQEYSMLNEENSFHVIVAGQNPPNPVELLSSNRMSAMLNFMRTKFDYIILDLPPVSEVSDAMAVAKETDGILLVVRQNYCSRPMLADTIQQFEFLNAKILGIVLNFASEGTEKGSGGYAKQYYNAHAKGGAAGRRGSYLSNAKSASARNRGNGR